MNFFKIFDVDKNMTSTDVERIGQNLTKAGKYLMVTGLYSSGLIFLTLLIAILINGPTGISHALAFNFDRYETIGRVFMGLSYMGMTCGILGILVYFSGLNIFALGRIAHNTEKEQSDMNSNASADANKGVKKENSHTTSNTSKNAENKSTATDTADDYYYDIQCPHCHSDLSIIKNHTYKDGFECPYCSKKISI